MNVNHFRQFICKIGTVKHWSTIKAADNRRLAQWRVMWLIEHSTSHQLLWCIDSFVLRETSPNKKPQTVVVIPAKQHHEKNTSN